MKIKVERDELLKALDVVSKAVKTNKLLPILECVILDARNGSFKLIGKDSEVVVESYGKCFVEESGMAAVNCNLFKNIVQKIGDEDIEIKTTDSEISIVSGKTKMSLGILDYNTFPSTSESIKENHIVKVKGSDFKNCVNAVSFASGTDENRIQLCSVFFNIKNGIMDAVGCNGFIMAVRKISVSSEDCKFLVRNKNIDTILKIIEDDEIELKISNNTIQITSDEFKITTQLLNGEYLDYASILKLDGIKFMVSTSELKSSMEKSILLMPEKDKKPVCFEIEEDLSISIKSTIGNLNESLKIDGCKSYVKGNYSPYYLLDSLKRIKNTSVSICVREDKNVPTLFLYDAENGEYAYMILPVRTKD